jgi:hypothetical protein
MRTAIRGKHWLLFLPLLMLGGNLDAQPSKIQEPAGPRTQIPEGAPELKVIALLTAKTVKEDRKDDELRKLLKARYNEAVADMKVLYKLYRAGASSGDRPATVRLLFEESSRLVQAGLELFEEQSEKVKLLTLYVELAREAEKLIEAMHRVNRVGDRELHRMRYERLDAEIQLLRCKRGADKAKEK